PDLGIECPLWVRAAVEGVLRGALELHCLLGGQAPTGDDLHLTVAPDDGPDLRRASAVNDLADRLGSLDGSLDAVDAVHPLTSTPRPNRTMSNIHSNIGFR